VALRILEEKRCFALHADPLSWLLYDLQFWLYQRRHGVERRDHYLAAYPQLIAFGEGFATGGYAPGFVEDWFDARSAAGQLVQGRAGLVLAEAQQAQVLAQLRALLADADAAS